MSGPKSSRYTLTPAQKKALMITRQKHLVQQERARLSALLAQVENDARSAAGDGEAAKAAGEEAARLISRYAPLVSGSLPEELEALEEQSRRMRAARQALDRERQALGKEAREIKEKRIKQTEQDLKQGFGSTLDSALHAKRDQKRQKEQERLAQLKEIASSAVTEETAAQAQKLLLQWQEAPGEAFRDTLYWTSVQPLIKRFRSEEEQYGREEEAYQCLLLHYQDLCEELSVPREPWPWTPGAKEALGAQVEQMEARILEREEEAYICRTLDEVMQEMGYPLLGTREGTKRSGRKFRHALYTFEDGTAIDVTYSDDGQIAMELGGLDDRDRIPDEEETVYLCDQMEGFCTSFAQIEERLKQKGVVLRERIRLLPPGQEHAQIINTEDYLLSAPAPMLDVKRRAEGEQRKKQMYKDGE